MTAFIVDAPPVAFWNSNPYAVAFSPDGTTLAVGSGGFYGNGGVSLVEVDSGADHTWRFVDPMYAEGMRIAPFDWGNLPLTVSGVVFDRKGDYLAICTWGRRHQLGPAILFKVGTGGLNHHTTLAVQEPVGVFVRGATGVCFAEHKLHVRHNSRRVEDIFRSCALPPEVDTNVTGAHRSHSRLVRVDQEVITGGHRLQQSDDSTGCSTPFTGLVVGPEGRTVPGGTSRVTAVLAVPGGGLLTGGRHGELVRWERDPDWRRVHTLRVGTDRRSPRGERWTTYLPQSVVGLCALEDGRFFSVDAGGDVTEWRDEVPAIKHRLPRPGTPRCIAVHATTPRGPMVAVGVKHSLPISEAPMEQRRGYIACLTIK